jgi:hypothetical protein
MRQPGRMHEFLTTMEKYNSPLPVYLEDPLSHDQIAEIRYLLDNQISHFGIHNIADPIVGTSRFVPRVMPDLARVVIEFEMPESSLNTIDSIIKPMYSEEIAMSHYSYLGYSLEYSDGVTAPSLPPHIDAAETLITFNYQIGGNIDWDIYVDGVPYSLKTGDAVVFSAVNQIHWRPKRTWRPGEYTEILTINYSPLDNWRFVGLDDPLGMNYPEQRKVYQETLNANPRMQAAWDQYNADGLKLNIPTNVFGLVEG